MNTYIVQMVKPDRKSVLEVDATHICNVIHADSAPEAISKVDRMTGTYTAISAECHLFGGDFIPDDIARRL